MTRTRTIQTPSELERELRELHKTTCLLRTHNGACDCPNGSTIDRTVTVTANYFQRQINNAADRIHAVALLDAQKQTR